MSSTSTLQPPPPRQRPPRRVPQAPAPPEPPEPEAPWARALRDANETRAKIRLELEVIADLDGRGGALRAAEILQENAEWSKSLQVKRLLDAVAGVGPSKTKALARRSRVDPALACRDIDPEGLHRVAAALRGHAADTNARPRATQCPGHPGARGFEHANRVRYAHRDALRAIAAAGGGSHQAAGAAAAAQLLRTQASDPALRNLKVGRVIRAIHRVGTASCAALLGEFALSPAARLGEVQPRKLSELADRLASAPTLHLAPGARALPGSPADDTPPPPVVGRLIRLYMASDTRTHAIVVERRTSATVIVDYHPGGAREVVSLDPAAGAEHVIRAAGEVVAAAQAQPQLEVLPATDERWVRRDGRLLHIYTHRHRGTGCVVAQRRGATYSVVDYTARQATTIESYPAKPVYEKEILSLAKDYVEQQRRTLRAA